MATVEKDIVGVWSKERTLLAKMVKEEGTKVTDVAKDLGKSHSLISLYVNGKYPSNDLFESSVREYLIKIGKWEEEIIDKPNPTLFPEDGWMTNAKDIPMVYTKDLQRVWGVCRVCFENREFGMITGDPGTGKTYAIDKFQTEMHSRPAVVITCDETSTIKSLLIDTAEALELETKGASSTLMRRIVKELQKKPRLLVFDEADLLRKPAIYETIRAIHDKAKVGVVLCGNHSLAEKILLYAEDRPEMARIRDRIGWSKRLVGINEEEALSFLEKINLTAGARAALVNIGRKRGIRQLVKALGRLLDVTRGEQITEDLVDDLGQIVLSFNA
ncbi:MAG: ATP-binding protein [Peptococcaceae bacterium]|nr:ATP-binding protein [Peptococcaceae bacterium]MDH7526017.1 ATP-binding protein [Peptococcaceae bacterium]